MDALEEKVNETCCQDPATCCPPAERAGPMPAYGAAQAAPVKKGISLKRIIYTTVGYGLAGSVLPNSDFWMPVGAIAGFGLSTYSEMKKRKMNLFYPGVGVAVGGVIGDAVGPHHGLFDHLMAYMGAGAGAWLGYAKGKETD